jgi:hypothetical protein
VSSITETRYCMVLISCGVWGDPCQVPVHFCYEHSSSDPTPPAVARASG